MSYVTPTTVSTGDAWTANLHNVIKGDFEANPPQILTMPGDLPVATGANALTRLGVGSNGQMLESRASEATGRKWVNSGLVPVGGILIWSGSVASIPTGWALCDGTGGTPDLRGRFVVGSGSSYASGATGGAASANMLHIHSTPNATTDTGGAHTHAAGTTSTDGAHSHSLGSPTGTSNEYYNSVNGGAATGADITHTHTVSGNTNSDGSHAHTTPVTGSAGGHTHNIFQDTGEALGTATNLRPPYYALAYIQRVS